MDDIFRKIDEHTQKYRVSHLHGTFRDYLPMVLENPKLAQLAHARIYEMVRSYGVDLDDQGTAINVPTPLPQAVNVRAVALPGYTLSAPAQWYRYFFDPSIVTLLASDCFSSSARRWRFCSSQEE